MGSLTRAAKRMARDLSRWGAALRGAVRREGIGNRPRLIDRASPLKQASLDSVHEKNVRHGHISTLHIWPARKPLAACRAALLADPGAPGRHAKKAVPLQRGAGLENHTVACDNVLAS
jgi:hypothetical protein